MKKIAFALSVLLTLTILAGCGGGTPSAANYQDVLSAARTAEENGVFYILSDAETRAAATAPARVAEDTGDGDDDSYTPPTEEEMAAAQHDIVFHVSTGFTEDVMQRYSISLGFSITQAYGIAIILPAQGKQQQVLDQVNNYIEIQKNAMENYLADQYEIASNALVKTVKSGEVILVMSKNAETIMAAIEAGLKG